MIYPDERPEMSALERAVRQRSLRSGAYSNRDEEELREALYGADLRVERQSAELKSLGQELRQARQSANEAQRRLESLQSLYERQTVRAEKFKSAYEGLKTAPELRIARAVSAPARKARSLLRGSTKAAVAGKRTEALTTRLNARIGTRLGESTVAESQLDEARRLYIQEGNIRQALKLLGGAPSGEQNAFTRQIAGSARLLDALPRLPEKQPNPGYLPERGRVLYCAHSTGEFNSNGYSTRTAGLTRAMSERGDVVVLARPGYPWDANTVVQPESEGRFERVIDGVKHLFNPGPSLREDPLDLYFQHAADIIAREAIMHRAAVIHAASNHVTGLPALMAARRLGLPFVYEVRGFWELTEASRKTGWDASERFLLAESLETMVAAGADRVLAITTQVRDELIRRGVEADRIDLLPNAADPFEFVPIPVEREIVSQIGGAASDVVVGYAGSVLEYEGLDLLVEAFGRAVRERPNLRLLIVGDGPALPRLRELAEHQGDRIIFTGRVPSKEVPRYLAAMDIVVCPRVSNAVTEMVSPLKPLEGMAAGKVVLASNVAPLADLLGAGDKRGVLFPAGDAHFLAQSLIGLTDDGERRADIGRSARAWVVKYRSWAAMAELVRASHQRLLEQRSNAPIVARDLSELTLALVSDEFTRNSLASECKLVLPDYGNWQEQLSAGPVDVLFVESAWDGNGGSWRGKIGYYDAESFAALDAMVSWCRARGIPTIFWNKEDPVHFSRFKHTATIFDHVFTTDGDLIPDYFAYRGENNVSIGSLPFWAQSRLHNPMPGSRHPQHTVAYGGTYYGDRYPDRSRELSVLLGAVAAQGVTIYDRQANLPESPYHFPESLAEYVRGGLSYEDMVQAYRAHPVHINVNSVTNSPTMFSRRVVELAATGTPVISGRGRGVDTMFNGLVPTPDDAIGAGLIAELWMDDEAERNADGWLLHRHAFRAHMAGHRLAYALRTAGLVVRTPELPRYRLLVDALDEPTAQAILSQTHRPESVRVRLPRHTATTAAVSILQAGDITTYWGDTGPSDRSLECTLGGALFDRTAAEDLCRAAALYDGVIQLDDSDVATQGRTLWEFGSSIANAPRLQPAARGVGNEHVLTLRRVLVKVSEVAAQGRPAIVVEHETRNVLVAGHDLKFAVGIIDWLRNQGHRVVTDTWTDHSQHDAVRSHELLGSADVVFCEWSLGNIDWYAQHRDVRQRLTSRFHSQELFTPHLHRLDVGLIDHTVFVGELIRQVAIRRFGYATNKTSVVPNALGVPLSTNVPDAGRRFTLGLVGMVPQQKHLDRALDLLAQLRELDPRYRLRVKGRRPEEYPWMMAREGELSYYTALEARIALDPRLKGAVSFDPHDNEMAEWYEGIGIALSVSDFESFHLTLADGAASGALPTSLAWPGADMIYPRDWIHSDLRVMKAAILQFADKPDSYTESCLEARRFAAAMFSPDDVYRNLGAVILGPSR